MSIQSKDHAGSIALQTLLEGNRRYVSGQACHPHQDETRRRAIAQQQAPFAAILGCADSRASLELIFDQGLGDLFVVRTAGQVLDAAVWGSLEYAVEHLHVPLLMVLGHTRCGAVQAALEALAAHAAPAAHAEAGHIGALVAGLRPAVEQMRSEPGDQVQNVVGAHVALLVAQLRAAPIFCDALAAGTLQIVGAIYDLETGQVALTVP